MRLNIRLAYAMSVLVAGCNTLEEPTPCEDCSGSPRVERIVPTDVRPPVVQGVRPPPVSGGTLLVTASEVVVSDPDRDRIVIVDSPVWKVRWVLPLERGDQPGRLAAGKNGLIHVALRGSGNVLTIDPKLGTIVGRTAVCGEPRGLAFDAVKSLLLVACAEGSLVELDGTTVVRRTALGPDLRDVVIQGDHVYVSRFRSAAILKLDAGRNVVSQSRPPTVFGADSSRPVMSDSATKEFPLFPFDAAVAWRMVAVGNRLVMVHQRAMNAVVQIDAASQNGATSPYGGSDCEGIVRPAVTIFEGDGTLRVSNGIMGAVLPVDVAVSPGGTRVAVASAGPPDPFAPVPSVIVQDMEGVSASGGAAAPSPRLGTVGVTVVSTASFFSDVAGETFHNFGCGATERPPGERPAIAVAFDATGRLFAQTREPSTLLIFPDAATIDPIEVPLGGDSRLDTGHELFHRDSGAGIACASCHPEGGEDGRVWHFNVSGERRTQPLDVGLADTAPFHWEGDLKDMGSLMKEVFVGRMNGALQDQARTEALSGYLFGLRAPKPVRPREDPAALRGKQVFESAEVGCASCHGGPMFTNNSTVEVGKGKAVQVPSLVSISRRAPYLHDGCATTLLDRFDPNCGGSDHGDVSRLTAEQLGDLVAYLESL